MVYFLTMGFEQLRKRFKNDPNYLVWLLNECDLNVKIVTYDGDFRTVVVRVKSLDDVVQCILKYA